MNYDANWEQQPPKKSGVGQKILISCCMGLFFGLFAGLGFFVVQKAAALTVNGKEGAAIVEEGLVEADADVSEEAPETEEPAKEEVPTTKEDDIETFWTSTSGDTVEAVAESVMPSMVAITKDYLYDYGEYYGYGFWGGGGTQQQVQAEGSGIIIGETDDEYLIVSNYHVVSDPITLTITFVDDSTAEAYIKGLDSDHDLAIVSVLKKDLTESTKSSIRIATLGDSNALKLGEQVVAIGNALGYGQSVTTGIVSALDREIENENGVVGKYIQTDAAINGGNSGGALLNMKGEVIGINSVKIASTAVEGMGYAIPISQVMDVLENLMLQNTKIKVDESEIGYIGISLQEVTASLSARFNMPVGIYIVETTEDGPAMQAGLQKGDIITYFDGTKITSYNDLQNILQYYPAGTEVSITYQRQEDGVYEEHTTQLVLGNKPQ